MRAEIIKAIIAQGKKRYAAHDIAGIVGVSEGEAEKVLRKLLAEGLVMAVKRKTSLVLRTPNVKALEDALRSNMKEDSGRQKMWRAIRVLRRFTRTDLSITAEQNVENVRDYTRILRRAGYLSESSGVWTLIKDPGPRRPHCGGD